MSTGAGLIPWEKYGLIAELARRFHALGQPIGRTMLEKTVYLLQELEGVDCGYDFSLYTYGPFAVEVLNDLDYVSALGGVLVTRDAVGRYDIQPGPKNAEIIDASRTFLDKHCRAIDRTISAFGRYRAKELELRATIVYVARHTPRQDAPSIEEEISSTVHEIKPRFALTEVREAVKDMRPYLRQRN